MGDCLDGREYHLTSCVLCPVREPTHFTGHRSSADRDKSWLLSSKVNWNNMQLIKGKIQAGNKQTGFSRRKLYLSVLNHYKHELNITKLRCYTLVVVMFQVCLHLLVYTPQHPAVPSCPRYAPSYSWTTSIPLTPHSFMHRAHCMFSWTFVMRSRGFINDDVTFITLTSGHPQCQDTCLPLPYPTPLQR